MSVILDHITNTLAGFTSPVGGATLKASGITQVVLSADGKIGIGNTDPTYPLDVTGVIRGTEFMGKGTFTGGTTVSDNSGSSALTITQDGVGAALTINDQTGDSSPFVVTGAGDVGIGTATPTLAKLHVMGGNIRTDGIIASDVTTGTAPLSIASTTVVPNLTSEHATKLNGYTWDAVPAIGATTAGTGRFTTLNVSDFVLNGDLVQISEGGTGAASTSGALDNLLPSGETPGYVLTTSGAGSYYWASAGAGGGSGTRINTSRKYFTATNGQTALTGLDVYTVGAGQVRVYVNGVRLYPEDYTENSTTSVTLLSGLNLNDAVMVETDGYISYAVTASTVSFSPVGNLGATEVQSALAELDNEKVPRDTLTGAALIPAGTTAERPTGAAGKFRYNSDLGKFEGYNGTTWGSVGGGGATGGGQDAAFNENDVFITTNYTIGQGDQAACSISNASPAVVTLTNTFIANQPVRFTTNGTLPTGLATDTVYYVHATGLSASAFSVSATPGGTRINTSSTGSGAHTVGKIKNAGTFGQVSVADGVTLTVGAGSTWTIS